MSEKLINHLTQMRDWLESDTITPSGEVLDEAVERCNRAIELAELAQQPAPEGERIRTLGVMDGTDWKYDYQRDRAWIDGREFAPVAAAPADKEQS